MWLHNVLCLCFVAILATKIETNAQSDTETDKPEALFADVIKNISRVNNELHNLIANYQKFKRTHSSQEKFDNTKASNEEGIRVNRNNKNNKGKPSDKATTNFYQTKIMYMDDEDEKTSGPEKTSEAKTSSPKQNVFINVDMSHENPALENTVERKNKLQKTTKELSTGNKEPIDKTLLDENTEPELQEFIDLHKKTDRLKRILSQAYQEPSKKPFNEKEKQTKYLSGNFSKTSSASELSGESDRHSEEKEEKLMAKKPQERAQEEKQVQVTAAFYLRSRMNDVDNTTTKKPDNASLESTESDDNLSKDMFKTSVLRKAYGDACVKLVIRKCFKACKSAYASTCRAATKCKDEFKEYFYEKSKTECLNAFNVSSKDVDDNSLRRIAGLKTISVGGWAPEGYLSVACQTPTRKAMQVKNNTEPLNILRDKYEKACAKLSQTKCTTACHKAEDAACKKYECTKNLQKYLKKNCKTSCKRFYSGGSNHDSSTSDSSSSDSDDSSSGSSDDDSSSS